jgi:hypothetical protein
MGSDSPIDTPGLPGHFRRLDTTHVHRWHARVRASAGRGCDVDSEDWVVRAASPMLKSGQWTATFRMAGDELKGPGWSKASFPS